MKPVDPVALGIPSYPQIVKRPMDISTNTIKLENGQYSSLPFGQSHGHSPASRIRECSERAGYSIKQEVARELADLVALRKALGENETSSLRRSNRARHPSEARSTKSKSLTLDDLEYFCENLFLFEMDVASLPTSRLEVDAPTTNQGWCCICYKCVQCFNDDNDVGRTKYENRRNSSRRTTR